MALTEANFRANLLTASRNAADKLGVNPANLTFDERRAYNTELANIILKYPNSFSPASVTSAHYVIDHPVGDLADASINWGDFGNYVIDEAAVTLPKIGINLLWAGVAIAIGGIFFYLLIHEQPTKT